MKWRKDGVGYQLGVDLGTTHTMAAVLRQGRAEIVPLGGPSGALRSIVFVDEDGTVVVGEAADERGFSDPARVVRDLKRRLGDPAPVVLGGAPYSPEALVAALLARVVDLVSEREGGPPDMVTISHPANWNAYRMDLLRDIIGLAGLEQVRTVSDPEAAAVFHDSVEEMAVGDVVAVYDLGGGTFDVAVARKVAGGFEMLGLREGIDRLGGIDFDEAVLSHISGAVGVGSDDFASDDPSTAAVLARLRAECAALKETLSTETEVSVPVFAPGKETEVRLTRADLEDLLRPALAQTVEAMRRSLRSAPVDPADLVAVLLVGGSAHVPLVARMVSEELGRPVEIGAQPTQAVALGAALSMRSWAPVQDRPAGEGPDAAGTAPQPVTPATTIAVEATTPARGPTGSMGLAGAATTALLGPARPATADAPPSPPAPAPAATTSAPAPSPATMPPSDATELATSPSDASGTEVGAKSPAAPAPTPDPEPESPRPPPMTALMVVATLAVAVAMIAAASAAGVLIATAQVAVGVGAVVVSVAAGVALFAMMRRPAATDASSTGSAATGEEPSP